MTVYNNWAQAWSWRFSERLSKFQANMTIAIRTVNKEIKWRQP